jgi:acetyl esterase
MALDAAVREFLATKPDSGSPDDPIPARRAAILTASDELFDRFGEPAAPVARTAEYEVSANGAAVRVRVYQPSTEPGRPLHLFFHGGGFWLGSIDERVVDATCRERALGADCVVVAVEYRLAPEHPFPAPLEDCYAALAWAVAHAEELGADPANVSVGGVSAGANLAAAVALLARTRGGPALRLQLLEVPPLDLTLATMRGSGVPDDYGITVAEMELCAQLYLVTPEQARDPLASPLLVGDLAGLPPAHVMTAEFDPLRRDGELYAERLEAAGVAARHTRRAGAVHGAILLTKTWEPARAWRDEVVHTLRQWHHAAIPSPTQS